MAKVPGHDEAVQYLLARKDYERATSFRYSEETLKLERMRRLLQHLGNPEQKMRIVHVAGTKGKGSTAAMIAATLTASGLRTGLFCSPHLLRIEERFQIDAADCPPSEFVRLVDQIRPAVERMDAEHGKHSTLSAAGRPTYFEMTTALAFCHFAKSAVDAAVLEVGLGGRLDSTNVCSPDVSVITNISFDHTKQLGSTLAAIAGEKAGIIKAGIPVVSGVEQDEPLEVIRRIAATNAAPIYELGQDFRFDYFPPRLSGDSCQCPEVAVYAAGRLRDEPPDGEPIRAPLRLLGRHQAANAAVAAATALVLVRQGWSLSAEQIASGLSSAKAPARIELVATSPPVIIDTAHNMASMAALCETLDELLPRGPRRLILGVTKDKDLRGMLELLVPRFDELFLTEYVTNPRAVPVQELAAEARRVAARLDTRPAIHVAADPRQAWNSVTAAFRLRSAALVITGSFFLAAELREIVLEQGHTLGK